ncbi:Alpha/Beta hydrolase protein [Cubamyces menziesii]|nr:Alpha/Beta hydrolase protein [Cubamyces menziesii]
MPASISKQTLVIAGITVNVFSQPSAVDSPVTVLFLLHGRTRSDADSEPIARGILEEVGRQREGSQAQGTQADDLIIVTFDHRNHGARLVDKLANWHWEEDPAKSNVRHAVDMYAIQTGTANDVSFLIDFLPAYLYPNDERTVVRWGVAGVSLGGHSTWITLKNDPRVTFGIPIIGCPDYLTLMSERAAQSKVPVAPPYFPVSFLAYVRAHDPAAAPHTADAPRGANPFRGKRVLVLCGKEDTLVPWSASRRFVEELDVGEEGVKEVWVEEGTGHRCSEGMVKRAGEFVWKQALVRGQ